MTHDVSKERKNGRFLNCFIQADLLDEFEDVCYTIGLTKTSLLERAMQETINPFYSRGEDGQDEPKIRLQKGLYKVENPKKPGHFKKVSCTIIDHIRVFGEPYCKIWYAGEIINVPADLVEPVSDA